MKDSDSSGAHEKGADKPPSCSSQQEGEYLTGVIEGEASSDTEEPPGDGEKEAAENVAESSKSAKRRSSTKSSTSEQGLLKPSTLICVNVIWRKNWMWLCQIVNCSKLIVYRICKMHDYYQPLSLLPQPSVY